MKFQVSFCFFILFFFLTCSPLKKTNPPKEILIGTSWILQSLYGNAANNFKSTAFLNFGKEGLLSGNTRCNSFSGKYSIEGNKIILNPGAMTRMMCPGSAEQDFLIAIKQVTNFKITAGKLILQDGNWEIMGFISK
jgi:heat shock protein HslJ